MTTVPKSPPPSITTDAGTQSDPDGTGSPSQAIAELRAMVAAQAEQIAALQHRHGARRRKRSAISVSWPGKWLRRGLIVLAALGWLLGPDVGLADTPNSWTQVASLPSARQGLAGATGLDGTIYAIGGNSGGGSYLNTVDAYNPTTDSWTGVAPMPTARTDLAAATGPDGTIYAMGGFDAGQFFSTVEAYHPASNSWTTVAPMPASRAGFAAVTSPDGLIYTFGGCCDSAGHALNTVDVYNPVTNTWSAKTPMPTARGYLAAAAGPDGKIYTFGGCTNNGSYTACTQPVDTVESYDPATDAWTCEQSDPASACHNDFQTLAAMPTIRGALRAVTGADGKIYTIGGVNDSTNPSQIFFTVEAYDPATNSWTCSLDDVFNPCESATMDWITQQAYFGAAAGTNGLIYTFGGLTLNGNLLAATYSYALYRQVSGIGNPGLAGVGFGTNGTGVSGTSTGGTGISGTSTNGTGVFGQTSSTQAQAAAIHGVLAASSPGPFSAAVYGENKATNGAGIGVLGTSSGIGIYGSSASATGILGISTSGTGISGSSTSGTAINGTSSSGTGVVGQTSSTAGSASAIHGILATTSPGSFSAAVYGENRGTGFTGIGVYGTQNGRGWGVGGNSPSGTGIDGTSTSGTGVSGSSSTGTAVNGTSTSGTGVYGQTSSTAGGASAIHGVVATSSAGQNSAAVLGENQGTNGEAIGVAGTSASGQGVSGTSTSGLGVNGTSSTGTAVKALSTGSGTGVLGESEGGIGGQFESGSAQSSPLFLDPSSITGHPTQGFHHLGEIYLDSAGALFVCTAPGTPGAWDQIQYVGVQQPIALVTGWNMVAGTDQTTGVIQSQINAAGGNVTAIAVYQAGKYNVWVPGVSNPFLVQTTQGMFILTTQAATWTPH